MDNFQGGSSYSPETFLARLSKELEQAKHLQGAERDLMILELEKAAALCAKVANELMGV